MVRISVFNNSLLFSEMKASKEEMDSANLDLCDRDYCAHLLIDYRVCRDNVWPFVYKCHHEKHTYLECEYDE